MASSKPSARDAEGFEQGGRILLEPGADHRDAVGSRRNQGSRVVRANAAERVQLTRPECGGPRSRQRPSPAERGHAKSGMALSCFGHWREQQRIRSAVGGSVRGVSRGGHEPVPAVDSGKSARLLRLYPELGQMHAVRVDEQRQVQTIIDREQLAMPPGQDAQRFSERSPLPDRQLAISQLDPDAPRLREPEQRFEP